MGGGLSAECSWLVVCVCVSAWPLRWTNTPKQRGGQFLDKDSQIFDIFVILRGVGEAGSEFSLGFVGLGLRCMIGDFRRRWVTE